MNDSYIAFNAINSKYYQPMTDTLASMGAGYKGPRFYAFSWLFIGQEFLRCQKFC
jgi:hypothetical protein